MQTEEKKLLNLALKALAKGDLNENDRISFSRDHRKFKNEELTFRELLDSIKKPVGELKEAMKNHYGRSVYTRTLK